MDVFNPLAVRPEAGVLPIEQAYAAVEAIDAAAHVDRVASIKAGIATKEAALDRAKERLQEVNAAIRDARQPDGDAIAFSLMNGVEMPPASQDLEREKDQLVAGINALSRQINNDYYPLRQPWVGLKQEIADAATPLIDEFYRQAQEVIGQIEALYAVSASLSRVVTNAKVDVLRRFSGTVLAHGREFRRHFDFQTALPVDPSLLTFNGLPAIKAMRFGMSDTVAPPSQVQMERDGL